MNYFGAKMIDTRAQISRASTFSKESTNIIKGVAILMMLFLHLFNHVDDYFSLLYVKGIPLVMWLSRASNPVGFYLFCGGVGMYSVYRKGSFSIASQLRRGLRLFVHYWAILLIFVTIGILMHDARYPGGFVKVIENVTGFHTTYNGECWFLLPYVLLTLLSKQLFKILDKWPMQTIVVDFIINLGTLYIISRYGAKYLFNNMWIYNPLIVISMSFNFLLGAASVKYWNALTGVLSQWPRYSILNWLALFSLIFVVCCIDSAAIGSLYVILFIMLFLSAPRSNKVDLILEHLGRHSMTMWLMHTWFCYYLFHDYIYGLKYPILIFLVLLLISYASSRCVEFMVLPIVRRIK